MSVTLCLVNLKCKQHLPVGCVPVHWKCQKDTLLRIRRYPQATRRHIKIQNLRYFVHIVPSMSTEYKIAQLAGYFGIPRKNSHQQCVEPCSTNCHLKPNMFSQSNFDSELYWTVIALILIRGYYFLRYFKLAVTSLFTFLVSSWFTTATIVLSRHHTPR